MSNMASVDALEWLEAAANLAKVAEGLMAEVPVELFAHLLAHTRHGLKYSRQEYLKAHCAALFLRNNFPTLIATGVDLNNPHQKWALYKWLLALAEHGERELEDRVLPILIKERLRAVSHPTNLHAWPRPALGGPYAS